MEMVKKMLKEGKITKEEADELISALKESYGIDQKDNKFEKNNYEKNEFKDNKTQKKSKSIAENITENIKKNIDGEKISRNIKKGIEDSLDGSSNIVDEIKNMFGSFFGSGYEFIENFKSNFNSKNPIIDIDNTNGKIKLRSWNKNEYSLNIKFNILAENREKAEVIKNKIYNIKNSDDNLQISIDNIKDHRISTDIFLTLPTDYFYQGNVESINGKIRIEDLNFNSFRLKTKNGKIDLVDIDIKEGKVESTNGKIFFDGNANKLNLSAVNGMITAILNKNDNSNIKIKTTNGTQNISLANKAEYFIDTKIKIGSISLNLDDMNFIKEKEGLTNKHYILKSSGWNENGINLISRSTNGSINID
ncbi:MAG: DUF4097 family beta strand repeat-containing protein [Bacillota bacterium]